MAPLPEAGLKDGVTAIIAAAGLSQRMAGIDKIFAPVNGRPLLFYTLKIFQESPLIRDIVLVAGRHNLERCHHLVKAEKLTRVKNICPGGLRRQDSIASGLRMVTGCRWVVIHDGARPCLSPELIESGLGAAEETGAAIAAIPVTDTVKEAENNTVSRTLDRKKLWLIQTPQVFRYDIISAAYQNAGNMEATDDASLVEALGYKVKIFPGSNDNIKVTTEEDLEFVEIILRKHKLF